MKRSKAPVGSRIVILSTLGLSVLGCKFSELYKPVEFVSPVLASEFISEQVATESSEVARTTLVSPTPSPAGQPVATSSVVKVEEPNDVEGYIRYVFGPDADNAIGVAKCESGLRKNAFNDKNRNGTTDSGIFQINNIHTKRYGTGFQTDWKENVRVAHKIFTAHGNSWSPWVCAKAIGHKNYLGQ